MNIEEINPTLVYLYAGLFFAGLICLIHHLFYSKKESTIGTEFELKPWRIKGLDLALVLTFIYLLIFAAGALTIEVYKWICGTEEIAREHEFVFGFPMHLAIIACLFGFFRYFNLGKDVPLNPVRRGIVSIVFKAVYFFLAAMPILLVGSYIWPIILEFLHLPTVPQDLVTQVENMKISPIFFMVTFLAVVLAPLSEELLFRVFIYRSLKSYAPAGLSAVISSLMFAGMHFNYLSFLPLFILGVWLCRSYEKTGNIWVPIILHALFNGNTLLVLLLMGT